jgi:hypothetical protein
LPRINGMTKTSIVYPGIKGNLSATFEADEGKTTVYLEGDPEGLRSLAKVLTRLARVNQSKLPTLPDKYASEHVHLSRNVHLAATSVDLCVGRLDEKSGKFDPTFKKRRRPRTGNIVHNW